MAAPLLVVEREVLNRSNDALVLDALNITERCFACQIGVFSEILKIASVHGSPVDIDTRA